MQATGSSESLTRSRPDQRVCMPDLPVWGRIIGGKLTIVNGFS
jgi:hypothetical protein